MYYGIWFYENATRLDTVLEKTTKVHGYSSVNQLLMDYRFVSSVLTPKHKKVEIVKAIVKSFTNQK